MATIIIRLRAGHDANGNGRRVFVAVDDKGLSDGSILGVEKDTGADDWKARWPRAKLGPTFETTLAEYRELIARDAATQRMMRGRR